MKALKSEFAANQVLAKQALDNTVKGLRVIPTNTKLHFNNAAKKAKRTPNPKGSFADRLQNMVNFPQYQISEQKWG